MSDPGDPQATEALERRYTLAKINAHDLSHGDCVRPGSARPWGSPKKTRVVQPYGAQSGTNSIYCMHVISRKIWRHSVLAKSAR